MLFVQPVTTADNIKDGYINNTKEVYILDGTTTTPIALPAAKTGYNFSSWSGNIVDGNITVHVVAKSGKAVSINGTTVAGLTSSRSDETKDGRFDFVTDSSGGCVAAGTLVTMSDGTTKKVEDIVAGDEVLVFNHLTGTYDI